MEWLSVTRVFGIAYAVCWVAYFALFARFLRASGTAKSSDPSSFLGMLLQFVALGLLFWFRREGYLTSSGMNVSGLVLGVLAVAITRRALQRLGEQWSLEAKVRPKHRLVTEGPYAWVRHPLYLSFLLLTLGTGLAFSSLAGLLLALPVSLSGAGIRITVEERLLRQRFGGAYRSYCQRVPALFPRLTRKGARIGEEKE